MKLADLIFWAAVLVFATGNTDNVLEWFNSKLPAQPVSVEKKSDNKPVKRDPNDIQTDW